ncbi:MAG: hypothetical protein WCF84_24755 [Anaerolineae bacterium]
MNPTPIIILILILLVGAAIFGMVLTGTFNPKEAAVAQGIAMQNPIDAARSQFNLEQDKILQEAKTQDQINQMNETQRYAQEMHDQDLAQRAGAFKQESLLKDWAVHAGVAGLAIILGILAFGVTLRLGASGWQSIMQTQATQQVRTQAIAIEEASVRIQTLVDEMDGERLEIQAQRAQLDHEALRDEQREAIQLKSLGQLNARMEALECKIELMSQAQNRMATQLSGLPSQVQARARGDDAGAHEHQSPGDKIIRLRAAS